jgi:hypothetical protein
MEEVKYGHTSTEEAAARIDAYCEQELERALQARGISTAPPNAERRLMRDLHNIRARKTTQGAASADQGDSDAACR